MRKLIAITQVSLDGVMQAPGGPEEDPTNGFGHGGWAMRYVDEAAGRVVGEIIAGDFDLLLGRRTYEIFAAYWPYQDDAIANAFNEAAKYVATRTLHQLDWQGARRLGGDLVDEIRRLKAAAGPALHLWGSGQLLQTLIAARLIDEYRIWVFPVVLGQGKRLFESGVPPGGLTLVETTSTPSGVVMSTYHPAGPLPRGRALPGTPSQAELARRRKLAAEGSQR
jgi:dihydrofolate reductase